MIPLKTGQELSPQELVKDLVYQGFQYNQSADQPGVFSHRGEIIDCWIPHNLSFTRIRFGLSTIEHIADIDSITGETITVRTAINIISPDTLPIQKKSKNKQRDFSFLIDLSVGDHIVHIDHGIGKFKGLQSRNNKEYFVIEYADHDTLYVPVEAADRIDKYIGAGNPPIHRLSGASWFHITKKVKEEIEKTARELIALYAQRALSSAPHAQPYPEEQELADTFPYEETPDQEEAIDAVLYDLAQPIPMDRLVCGDVGFGKTEVAIRAAFRMVLNGYQVAVLAPTTILTQQHVDTFKKRLDLFTVRVEALSRFQSKDQQKKTLTVLASGSLDIVIGTHRLLSKDVIFHKLGLVIIDEEQKFGVKHKEQLKKMRADTHVLTLSATPIPRTLHFSLAGIRDMSVISTPPDGRLPIKNSIEPYSDSAMYNAVMKEKERNGQIYYLYNKVETMPSRVRQLRELLPNISIEHAHGQMDEKQLAHVMHLFDSGEIDMLVCSTIIENGLDLPNVNTLIIEDSTKFGLAQLYQLRGRIGRGLRQAYAYFMYHRLSTNDTQMTTNGSQTALTEKELKRLEALEQATELGSGFHLATRDMEIRGVGNMLGKAQHGTMRAIGLSLYERLLSQAVEEIKTGVKAPILSDIVIDLPLSYGIPPSFETNEQKRMALYQRLAYINDLEELDMERTLYCSTPSPHRNPSSVSGRIQDDNVLQSIATFFSVLELKILCRNIHATSITTSTVKNGNEFDQQKISIEFSDHFFAKKLDTMLEKFPQWKVGEKHIKMPITADNWFDILIHSLRVLS
ncbi:MAG TPA: DEAD/DEAH box helicase [Patescibacteria group bacterium]|nr:DEAD/DEAH box helicase [Patescibacteria group bacterium]